MNASFTIATPRRSRRWRLKGRMARIRFTEFIAALPAPRAVWIMVPAAIVDQVIADLRPLLKAGDTIIDGGNSHYHEDMRRANELAAARIHYVDVGTSGGVLGLERGFCLMIGGEAEVFSKLEPIFATLAPGADRDARRRAKHRGARLPALRRARRRPFREDGPQRHRVRPDGRLRRGLQHPEARRRGP